MNPRLQSAMEYLMTYGWAILIIALILGVLYELGVFNPPIANDCVPESGFLCQQLVFSANTVNAYGDPSVSVNLAIISTQPWSNVYFVVVPEGQQITDTVNGAPDWDNANDLFYWGEIEGQYYTISSLSEGEVVPAKIYINTQSPLLVHQSLGIGTKLTGAIWAMYSTSTTTNAVVEVGIISAVSEQP